MAEIHIPCPQCHLMDFYITYNEAAGISQVKCQNCSAPFIQIQYVPEILPDPAVVI